ncbi:MAG: cobalamin biosynthesis protein CbiD [Lachnospiraceae bacterium]|nr:cobalamin biosynthesis protein CbiD [Lachnospiraceae bacterium]
MAFEHYIRSGQKELRCGYTTGTCAALAASAAAKALLTGTVPETAGLMTAKGLQVDVFLAGGSISGDTARCSVLKDAGDDSDVTDGAEIAAEVRLTDVPGIMIDGGEGVGRVTKPGLDQPVGNAAINSKPRRYIAEAVQRVLDGHGYEGGAEVIVSVPEGREIAKKTFNEGLGIIGGISILGTSGIVEPMSEKALVDSIELSVNQAAASSKRIIFTPGNYGETYIKNNDIERFGVPVVKCSNFIGDVLDMAVLKGFEHVLLIGHMGKFAKLAAGIMTTHSRYADGRREVFCANAAICGASADVCRELMKTTTSDACIEILEREGLRGPVLASIIGKIQEHLDLRVKGALEVGALVFSNVYGTLGATDKAEKIMKEGS